MHKTSFSQKQNLSYIFLRKLDIPNLFSDFRLYQRLKLVWSVLVRLVRMVPESQTWRKFDAMYCVVRKTTFYVIDFLFFLTVRARTSMFNVRICTMVHHYTMPLRYDDSSQTYQLKGHSIAIACFEISFMAQPTELRSNARWLQQSGSMAYNCTGLYLNLSKILKFST